jgi:hypothetical protein
MITNYFKFHPVGQGGFYSGHINHPLYPRTENSFDFVFDCGTISLKNRFKDFVDRAKKNFISKNKLDVLFISHLDDDHVNGIKFLIPNIRCENIYLPYLTPFERLNVLIRHSKSDTDDYDDFTEFIINPIQYLNSIDGADIGQINYITGNAEGFPEGSNPEPPVNPGDFNGKFSDNLEPDNDDSNEEIRELRSDPRQKVVFKKANRKLFCGDIWEFYLYHIEAHPVEVGEFIKELNDLYKIEVSTALGLSDFEEIVKNKENLKILRKKFKNHFKSLNKTGLIVQHKPINYVQMFFDKRIFANYPYNYFHPQHYTNSYTVERDGQSYRNGITLLTGDIDFKDIESSPYINSHLECIHVFQVSHHGSFNGWSNDLLKYFSSWTTTAVINFGFGNKYGHPRPEVLEDLHAFNFEIKFCNQFDEYHYRITLNFNR